MAGSAAYARIKADVLDLARRIPAGRVATHKHIGVYLKVMPRHIAYILATLDGLERETVPWWRVVADGGAIGRHLRRDEQMQRLRAEGVVLSPVGIVQDLAERAIEDVAALAAGRILQAPTQPVSVTDVKPSRSRGMRGKPTSSV
jgi:methylated-DNA-protein-cysteine methyltransferase related protein